YSEVMVRNTGNVTTSYRVDASFDREFTTVHLFPFPSFGLGQRSYDIQMLGTAPEITLGPGEESTVRIEYLGQAGGSIPSGPISFTLTGASGNGFYLIAR